MKNVFKVLVGLGLIVIFHLPRLIYLGLIVSYAAVFTNRPTLTASPLEHLNRARLIIKRGRRSELLYAALEIRFALERMVQKELVNAKAASNRMLDEHSPVKKISNLHKLDVKAAFAHELYAVNKQTGERSKIGDYKPLDRAKVHSIHGRLGDLLHPKDGIALGSPGDQWYISTRKFLEESVAYLTEIHKDNISFFLFEGFDHIEMVKVEKSTVNQAFVGKSPS